MSTRYTNFEKLPLGAAVARYIQALGIWKGDFVNAHAAVENNKSYDSTPGVGMSLLAGTKSISNPLTPSGLEREFFELFQSRSIFGTVKDRFFPGLFTDFLTPCLIQSDSPIQAAWLSQSGPSPVCVILPFSEHFMKPTKVSFIVALNDELLRDPSLGSGRIISRILARTTASAIDSCFLSDAPPTDDSPGGICHDAPTVELTGRSTAETQTTLASMAEKLLTWRDPVFFMSPAAYSRLSLLGLIAFTGERGRLCGYDIVTTTCTDKIILCDVGSVLLADDGETTIDHTTNADIFAEIGGETKRVSLFQDGMSAFKVQRVINWYRPKESSVVWCSFPPETPSEDPEDEK